LFIAEQCDEHGIPRELRLFLLEGHGTWEGRVDGQSLQELVLAFLDTWM
jgi:hypothetical protein